MRMGLVLGGALVAAALVAPRAEAEPATPAQLPDPTDIVTAGVRQVCELQWIAGVCELTEYPEPQYRSNENPSPGQPLTQRVGAVHNHSGYSDGDPTSRPADYFTAAHTGHNVADAGGDTGVRVEYLMSSEHSENEKLPVTTAAECINLAAIPDKLAALDLLAVPPLSCSNVTQPDHYRKWDETLAQAVDATEFVDGAYTGFTAMRGFEWTNDYFNHLGVYFSRNVVNAKADGSYVSMDQFWNWLRQPAEAGGGSDALVVFNHPGGNPALTPFDGDLVINQVLADTAGNGNWNNIAYIADVDERVAGIEVNRGDDLSWFIKALTKGWHLGPVAAEDEHQREWSSTIDGKTLMLTGGRSPRDYYYAFSQHRTVAVSPDLVGGEPGELAVVPQVLFWANGTSVDDPAATVLGGTLDGAAATLEFSASGLPAGSQVVLWSNTSPTPIPIGTASPSGAFRSSTPVTASGATEDWWFVTTCDADVETCGVDEDYGTVTAPIWVRPLAAGGPVVVDGPAAPPAAAPDAVTGAGPSGRLPATGVAIPLSVALIALGAGLALWTQRNAERHGRPA